METWTNAIPGGKTLTKYDSVCELHFREDEIDKYFTPILLKDGSIYREKKDRPTLKKGSVPSVFPEALDAPTAKKSLDYANVIQRPNVASSPKSMPMHFLKLLKDFFL